MKQLQLIFDEVVEKQARLKDIKKEFKRELDQDHSYQQLIEDMKDIRGRMEIFKMHVLEKLGSKAEEMSEIAEMIKEEKEMMSDVAITNLKNGDDLSVIDSRGIAYTPVFSVRFKKIS